MIMPKKVSLRKYKSDVLKAQKTFVRAQNSANELELEGTEEFVQRVVVAKNPAVTNAKRKKIAYTIARGGKIVEVDGDVETTIGVVKQMDIAMQSGTVYTLIKN